MNNKSIGNSEYIAPEYEDKGKVSSKTDVYSFGVVILELITGRKAADKISGDKKLVAWVRNTSHITKLLLTTSHKNLNY